MEKEYIDLGLSVKWANCNEGANSPEERGDLLTYEKAMELVGDKLPTIENWIELQKNCTIKFNLKKFGFEVIGKNGNSIFLPITKEKEGDFKETGSFFYSSDTCEVGGYKYAKYAYFTVKKDILSRKYKHVSKVDCNILGLHNKFKISIRTVQK